MFALPFNLGAAFSSAELQVSMQPKEVEQVSQEVSVYAVKESWEF